MSKQREGWRRRSAGHFEWSDRQREVLDLLAKGRTNRQIAEHLGITLDGAKYHVREIVERLGVDTRDEAAEWWRQQHGMRARLRVVTRFGSFPVFFRWAGGAAALAAVVAVALFVVLAMDGEAGEGPGFRAAITLPGDIEDCPQGICSGIPQDLFVVDDEGRKEAIGEPGLWLDLAWSPDGRYLAALLLEEDADIDSGERGFSLLMFDANQGSRDYATLSDAPTGMLWGPESSFLYVFGVDSLSEVGTDSTVLREVRLDEAAGSHVQGALTPWSPDGQRALINPHHAPEVFDREELSLVRHDLAPRLPEPPGAWGEVQDQVLVASRWLSDEEVEFAVAAHGPDTPSDVGWRGIATLGGDEISVESELVEGMPLIELRFEWYPHAMLDERISEAIPYGNHSFGCSLTCISSDGGMQVLLVAHAPEDGPSVRFEEGGPEVWPDGTQLAFAWRDGETDFELLDLSYELRGPRTFSSFSRLGIIYSAVQPSRDH